MPDATDDAQRRRERAARESLARDSLLIVGVDGMHSHACEAAVVRALQEHTGVREAEVDFPSGQASVIFDNRKVAAHQLLEAVEAAGYRVGVYHLGNGGMAPERAAGG
jgi:copper chaperone CopZ